VTRRGLLRALLLATGLDRVVDLRMNGRRAAEAAARPASVGFSDAELEDLIAFAEVLVEGRGLSPEERRHLLEHIETRMRLNRWYVSLYRTTVQLVNHLAGDRFSAIDIAGRIALMTRHRLVSSDIRPGEDLGPLPDEARQVRTRAVPDLINGYYGSPVGWALVGYDAFPGTCGDLTRYTGPGA
jgi:hypothetical protein